MIFCDTANGHRLTASMTINAPLEAVFAFFSRAENLQRITPPWVNFRFLEEPPEEMAVGVKIPYAIRVRGMPLRWLTEITAWEPPCRFVDTQLKGPYKIWIHEHRFEAVPQGIRMTDTVDYRLPLGWAGRQIHRLLVRRDIEQIFSYRQTVIRDIFKSK